MSPIILYDLPQPWQQLKPLTFTRPISELRIGILTLRQKWERRLDVSTQPWVAADYLRGRYPATLPTTATLFINASLSANDALTHAVQALPVGEALYMGATWVATHVPAEAVATFDPQQQDSAKAQQVFAQAIEVTRPWHLFEHNDQAIREDFAFLTQGRTSAPISSTNTVMGAENIFLEAGATVECAILNATTGPIYVGAGAEIMEGSIVRGALAMAEKSVLKMGSKIYGATTLGTYCKVGGEVSNSVLQAYSNKGHEGYLGNSVLGEWCNLGADTNNSNLKNNYQPVKLWDYSMGRFARTGLQFCGLIMGDHSKCGINTMFNTGTVVGVHANIFGAGFPRNFVPSFSWGGASGFTTYRLDKAMETAQIMMARRSIELSAADWAMYEALFEETKAFRRD